MSLLLAIETSCDDTCAAVVDGDGVMHSNVISSQRAHEAFGGVVPEVASRHHLELVNAIVARALQEATTALDELDAVAATQGPGLVGALLVGFSTAKALAAARRLPFVPVDHLQGHVAANFLHGEAGAPIEPPFLCLIASGGHTLLARVERHDSFQTLGRTLDDAAGEAFDKGARMLGLGFPGGPALEKLAAGGDPAAFRFPGSARERREVGRSVRRRAFDESLDFSFAGVKTALLYKIRELPAAELAERGPDLAASYQDAILESLLRGTERALEQTGLERVAVGGGVAANGELRRRLQGLGVPVHIPERSLCTDNAAMIASAARYLPPLAYPDYLGLDAYATGEAPA